MRAHLDWTFDEVDFKTLPQVVDDLHANGQHYIMIIVSINCTTIISFLASGDFCRLLITFENSLDLENVGPDLGRNHLPL